MAEMGSFIELEYPSGKEYYSGQNIVRLNSGRAAIYHAIKSYKCETVYLPYYQCGTVREFLGKKNIDVKYYTIDENFIPQIETNPTDSAIVIVNYFGTFSISHMKEIASKYNNVIIDNSQSFFSNPIENCLNVYSARKFFGVPDGAYVVGQPFLYDSNLYDKDYSSDTALFLLQRIEYGCEGKAYKSRTKNEERLDNSDALFMSDLTRKLLDGIDYENARKKRIENFEVANYLLGNLNKIDATKYFDNTCVPMVFPFVSDREDLLDLLLKNKHFQGRWWHYLIQTMPMQSFEYRLSKYMVPITIDQRYSREEITALCSLIKSL